MKKKILKISSKDLAKSLKKISQNTPVAPQINQSVNPQNNQPASPQQANPQNNQQAVQPNNQQVPQQEQMNNRIKTMIATYNKCFNSSLPIDLNTYESLGRSNGIMKTIASKPEAFKFFFDSIDWKTFSGSQSIFYDVLFKYFSSVSR